MSLLHDWGPGDKDKRNPVDISRMSEERLSRLAFYFGGVGDGHHVLGSIIRLSQARLKLNKRKRQAMQAYLTMNNVHTSALARDLCLLSLLDELSSLQDSQTKVAEVKMMLISLWMGCIMPLYCFTRLAFFISSVVNMYLTISSQVKEDHETTHDQATGHTSSTS